MNILIAGDFYVSQKFENNDILGNCLKKKFKEADYKLVNLEAPITKSESKIKKTGPNLKMSNKVLKHLDLLSIDGVTLANNHILDYGSKGLEDTIDLLKKDKVEYVGAGNLEEITKPILICKDDVKVCVLNFCENEWSTIYNNSCYANSLDIISNVRQIEEAKAKYDKVICIIHGGSEFYNLPSPRIVKQYRFYVDHGADAIVCHHSHCISGFEVYKEAPIIYSLGNFIFTLPSGFEDWYTGLLVELDVQKQSPIKFKLHPIKLQKKDFKTLLLYGEEKEEVLNKVERYNDIISVDENLKICWNNWVNTKSNVYLNFFSFSSSIKNSFLRSLINKLKIRSIFYNSLYYKMILNLLRCESHRDVVKSIMLEKMKRKSNVK